jgi:NAD(P)H-nitrite reductase large subunit
MPVTRCVCHNLAFDALKAVADEGGLDFDALRERTGACTACGMCEPYIRLMLATGETRFRVLNTAGAKAALARHAAARRAGAEASAAPPAPPTAA